MRPMSWWYLLAVAGLGAISFAHESPRGDAFLERRRPIP